MVTVIQSRFSIGREPSAVLRVMDFWVGLLIRTFRICFASSAEIPFQARLVWNRDKGVPGIFRRDDDDGVPGIFRRVDVGVETSDIADPFVFFF